MEAEVEPTITDWEIQRPTRAEFANFAKYIKHLENNNFAFALVSII